MWGFYFNELMNSLPFFLKGLWMTVAVSGLSLIGGTILGFICGIIRASGNKLPRVRKRRAEHVTCSIEASFPQVAVHPEHCPLIGKGASFN